MTPNQLPPLPHIEMVLDHPEHHMKWTRPEVKWIQKYATDYALTALAQQAQVKPFAYMADDVAAGVIGGQEVLLSAAIRGAPGGTFNFPPLHPPQQAQEPVAWIRRHPNGALSNELLIHVQVEQVRRDSGAWVPLYTTSPAPQVPAPVDERAEFERWLTTEAYYSHDLRRTVEGPYVNDEVDQAWDAWQARAALQSPAPQTKDQP